MKKMNQSKFSSLTTAILASLVRSSFFNTNHVPTPSGKAKTSSFRTWRPKFSWFELNEIRSAPTKRERERLVKEFRRRHYEAEPEHNRIIDDIFLKKPAFYF